MVYDVIVCGSASVDVFAKTDAETIEIKGFASGKAVYEKLLAYPLGTKILMKELQFATGGGGTNFCATFATLGLKTAYVGKIGKDAHGVKVFDWLKENKVAFLGQVGGQTGYSVILDSQADDRTILAFKGANNELDFEKLPRHELRSRWFFAGTMLGKSYETIEKLLVFAQRTKMLTAFNPSNYLVVRGLGFVKKALAHTDVLILNKEEAELLVGVGSCPELAERLSTHGPRLVTVSNGDDGAYVYATERWDGKKEGWHVSPAASLKIVETTGAGDAFGSGFVAGLILGKPVREAALMGVINAEHVIAAYGAKCEIPTRAQMNKLLAADRKSPTHKIQSF